jgi:hypothetical protein
MAKNCLPGLYPREGMPAYAPESEKKVYKALADALPAGWYAWHSVKLRSQDGVDAEADFIIATPGDSPASPDASTSRSASGASSPPNSTAATPAPQPPGILILEVKGGAIIKKDGEWHQAGKPMSKPPRSQAIRARVALLSKFDSRGKRPPAIGEAVLFPDQDYAAPPTQGDLDGLILGARELPYLKELLPNLMRQALPLRIRRAPDAGWIEMLHDFWCESWPVKPNLSFQARARREERVKLDDAQLATLSAVIENDLVLVQGVAGTGKTILAAELARREVKSGRQILFLTFTEALAFELAKELSHPLITVSPVGRFALDRLRSKGFSKPEEPAPEFWEGVTKLAARWRSRSLWRDCTFETVIIDEAQDFGRHEWRIVGRCAPSEKQRIWAFLDESQAFWEKRRIPASFLKKCTRLNLGKPYRCPPSIQALADAYLGKEIKEDTLRLGLDDGTVGIGASLKDKVHEAVGTQINILLEQGFKPSDIAVISLRGRMFDENIMHRRELGGHPIVSATDDRAPEHVVCDTFLRFKGLERLAVIVTDLLFESSKYNVRMNIALSRAVGILRVIGAQEEIQKDAILKRLS